MAWVDKNDHSKGKWVDVNNHNMGKIVQNRPVKHATWGPKSSHHPDHHHKEPTFWDKVKHFFTDTIGGGIKDAWNWVSGGVSSVVSTVHDDATNLVKGIGSLIEKTEDNVTGVVTETVKDTKDLGVSLGADLSSMSVPLAVGAVAIAAIFLLKK